MFCNHRFMDFLKQSIAQYKDGDNNDYYLIVEGKGKIDRGGPRGSG